MNKRKERKSLILVRFFFVFWLITSCNSRSDSTERQIPLRVFTKDESFTLRFFDGYEREFILSDHDTIDWGNDGFTGQKIEIIIGDSEFTFECSGSPEQQKEGVLITNDLDSTMAYVRFNARLNNFDSAYVEAHRDSVYFEIPMSFELANIVWLLSGLGDTKQNIVLDGNYVNEIRKYFTPFLTHSIFDSLRSLEDSYFQKYFGFRDNSLSYSFDRAEMLYDVEYAHLFGPVDNQGGLFKDLIDPLQSFSNASNFVEFYKSNQAYYDSLIANHRRRLPVKEIWDWLESNFDQSYHSYKVIFSPLVGGSHSTARNQFIGYEIDEIWFTECLMFISDPGQVDRERSYSDVRLNGLQAGIFFTEVDHNYVNPSCWQYSMEIDMAFGDLEFWSSNSGYANPMATFLEYMTHALFSAYVLDSYSEADAQFLIDKREALMAEKRGFIVFREFNEAFIDLYTNRGTSKKAKDLIKPMIDWSASFDQPRKAQAPI